jgi:hypothetical protein
MKLPIKTSIKHVQINKANNMMLIVTGVASFVIAFSLLGAKALLAESKYQHKVLDERSKAIKQLKSNINAAKTLKTQYDVFENGNPNIIGGKGGVDAIINGASDGDNARIVLDALPSQYDFPALTSSLEKILNNDHVTAQGIGGTDQGQNATSTPTSNGQPQPALMAFSITSSSDYNGTLTLIKDFERSIRPVDIVNISLAGTSSSMVMDMQANTYYQPAMTLQIKNKEIH